ncbi:MAG: hypothetical protein KTR13_00085 [Saprospiraceae bacterium]|nr:hypothetical protein [Saprospiraceae bacterium]
MSTKLIILLIGALLTLIAILGSRKGKSDKRLIDTKVGIPMGILGVLMMMFGSYSSDLVNYNRQIEQVQVENKLQVDYPIERVQVISPIDGNEVACRILTMGVYPEGHTNDIWVVLKPTDKKYYPQSDNTNTSYKENGEWQVITRFGGDDDEPYELIVYETDAEASAFFEKTIEDWKEADEYIGLLDSEMPSGAKEVDRLTVKLRKNCRGVF